MIMVLLMVVSTILPSPTNTSETSLSVLLKDGYLIFHIQGNEGDLHDAVVLSNGSRLGTTQIASNLWRCSPASSGTFSVIDCGENHCTPLEFEWEVEYEDPPTLMDSLDILEILLAWLSLITIIGVMVLGVVIFARNIRS